MAVPQSTDYRSAIQNPHLAFRDTQLRDSQPAVNSLGLPLAWSGNFAVIYKFTGKSSGECWAVKCFTRDTPGLEDRYRKVSQYLQRIRLPFLIPFEYLDQGVAVKSDMRPIVKMPWVEGIPLHDFVRDSLDKPDQLRSLARIWVRMVRKLRESQIAHGDLQHGNVLLVRSATDANLHLKLVDYDGMYVPGIKEASSGETGHPAYQHPERLRSGLCNSEIDRFSGLAVYTALACLRSVGRGLWNRYDNADNLLFREEDYQSPESSPLFQELWMIPDLECRSLVGRLVLACSGSLSEVPLLDDLVGRNRNLPLNPKEVARVSEILSSSQTIRRSPRSISEEDDTTYRLKEADEGDWWSDSLPPAPPPPKLRRKKQIRSTPNWTHTIVLTASVAIIGIVSWFGLSSTNRRVIERYEAPVPAGEVSQERAFPNLSLESLTNNGQPSIPRTDISDKLKNQEKSDRSLAKSPSPNRSQNDSIQEIVDSIMNQDGSEMEDSGIRDHESATTSSTSTYSGTDRSPPPLAVSPFSSDEAKRHQEAWAEYLGTDVEITNSIGMKLILIPPGDYILGDMDIQKSSGGDEIPEQPVKVSQPFYLGKTEVTWKEWMSMGKERKLRWYYGRKEDDDELLPVRSVNYSEVAEFCQLLSKKERKQYRLPTVSEWEYACRSGTTSKWFIRNRTGQYHEIEWGVHPVGQKMPNPFGLYGMYENVCEWCNDKHRTATYNRERNNNEELTSYGWVWSYRGRFDVNTERDRSCNARRDLGFRVCQTIQQSPKESKQPEEKSARNAQPPLAVSPFGASEARSHQEAWADYLGTDLEITNSIGMRLILIPPGEFTMGNNEQADDTAAFAHESGSKEFNTKDIADEHPKHKVKLSKPFFMGIGEVTQGQWIEVMGTTPWVHLYGKSGDAYPARSILLREAQMFCSKLTANEETKYRLPTEAEWEYACRAGTITRFNLTNGNADLSDYAWYYKNAYLNNKDRYPHETGSKWRNGFGLFDMHGNVWEMCSDIYDSNWYSSSPEVDPEHNVTGSLLHVARGGSFQNTEVLCRSSQRSSFHDGVPNANLGFRVCFTVDPTVLKTPLSLETHRATVRPADLPSSQEGREPNPRANSESSVGTALEQVYRSMKLSNVQITGGSYSAGENLIVTYELSNVSKDHLRIPKDDRSGKNIVGIRQHWIERKGNDKTIPGKYVGPAKSGDRYAAGGSIISTDSLLAPGDSIRLEWTIRTNDFPAGGYTYVIEYQKLKGDVIQTESVDLDLR